MSPINHPFVPASRSPCRLAEPVPFAREHTEGVSAVPGRARSPGSAGDGGEPPPPASPVLQERQPKFLGGVDVAPVYFFIDPDPGLVT